MKILKRKCAICGREITVWVEEDGSYSGGHYFGKIDGKEYWECEKCYNNSRGDIRVCPRCGLTITAGDKKCPRCGYCVGCDFV